MTIQFAPVVPFPDLVFGLVGPIGVDLDYVGQSIADSVVSYGYAPETISITTIMRELISDVVIDDSDVANSYITKIEYANDLRLQYATNDVLAALAISAIQRRRRDLDATVPDNCSKKGGIAFVVRQFKTPEEIRFLRAVYGTLFLQISVHAPRQKREEYLVSRMKLKSKGTKADDIARESARELIQKDSKEPLKYGQNIRDTFPLGDLFIDSSNR